MSKPTINRVVLMGHLGRDPEVHHTAEGSPVVRISLATTEAWKDKAGNRQERTEWHRVVFFNRQAEIAAKYLKQGAYVHITGRLQTQEWEKDGVKHYTTDIVAKELLMLGRPAAKAGDDPVDEGSGGFDDFEDDIPF